MLGMHAKEADGVVGNLIEMRRPRWPAICVK